MICYNCSALVEAEGCRLHLVTRQGLRPRPEIVCNPCIAVLNGRVRDQHLCVANDPDRGWEFKTNTFRVKSKLALRQLIKEYFPEARVYNGEGGEVSIVGDCEFFDSSPNALLPIAAMLQPLLAEGSACMVRETSQHSGWYHVITEHDAVMGDLENAGLAVLIEMREKHRRGADASELPRKIRA